MNERQDDPPLPALTGLDRFLAGEYANEMGRAKAETDAGNSDYAAHHLGRADDFARVRAALAAEPATKPAGEAP